MREAPAEKEASSCLIRKRRRGGSRRTAGWLSFSRPPLFLNFLCCATRRKQTTMVLHFSQHLEHITPGIILRRPPGSEKQRIENPRNKSPTAFHQLLLLGPASFSTRLPFPIWATWGSVVAEHTTPLGGVATKVFNPRELFPAWRRRWNNEN